MAIKIAVRAVSLVIIALSLRELRFLSAQDTLAWRVLKWTEAEQSDWIKATLDKGIPPDQGDVLTMLVLNKSSLTMLLMEKKIEQVLASPSPKECFTDRAVDPQKFVHLAGSAIAYAANEEAIETINRLLKIDEKRFSHLVDDVLFGALSRRKAVMTLAYRGLEIGEPLAKKVVAWVEAQLQSQSPLTRKEIKERWAEALVERYGRRPVQSELEADPLLARVTTTKESLRTDLAVYSLEVWEKHPRRMLAMSEAEQVAFTKSYLDQGFPRERREAMMALIRGKSALVLPLFTAKIEEVLKSTKLTVNDFEPISSPAARTVLLSADLIGQAADEQALKEFGRLARLDETLFPVLRSISVVLDQAEIRGNPFPVVYAGIAMQDPIVSAATLKWAEERLEGTRPTRATGKDIREDWAGAMVDRYQMQPSHSQWSRDPIVMRLKPALAERLRSDIQRLAGEAAGKRNRR